MKLRLLAAVVAVATLPVTPDSPFAAQATGQLAIPLPPGIAYPHVYTYPEFTARWWQWFLSIPLATSPGAGGECSTGQLGSVWFLAARFDGPGEVRCTVPQGKMLFFPIINAECSDLESAPFFGATPEARKACAKAIVDGASSLSVTINGVPLQNLQRYRVASPDFEFAVPPDNVIGVPVHTDPDPEVRHRRIGRGSGDGYYVMIAPLLLEGTHRIRVNGSFPAFGFTIDTTFVITVRR
jgi:hypothetical protein